MRQKKQKSSKKSGFSEDSTAYTAAPNAPAVPRLVTVELAAGGRIVIPAPMRSALGMKIGDRLTVRLEGKELRIHTYEEGLRQANALVDKYLPGGAGAVFSFDCRGGRAAGQDFIRGVTLWSHLANVGDSKSLIIHPASTTHRQLNDEELRAAGAGPGTIRLSVGIESVDDLIWDLEQGFARAAAAASAEVASR